MNADLRLAGYSPSTYQSPSDMRDSPLLLGDIGVGVGAEGQDAPDEFAPGVTVGVGW